MCKIQKIKSQIDVRAYYRQAGVELGRHTGRGWHQTKALCLFHPDRRAGTLYVNVYSGKFFCHSCGSRGDVFDFHAKKHGFTLRETLKDLGGRFNG